MKLKHFILTLTETPIRPSFYFREDFKDYSIISYTEISDSQKDFIEKTFNDVMKLAGQDKLKEKFNIKIFYNEHAFNSYYENKRGESIYSTLGKKIGACYDYRENCIWIPKYYVEDTTTLSHEIFHAIAVNNEIKLTDPESMAYIIGEYLDKRRK